MGNSWCIGTGPLPHLARHRRAEPLEPAVTPDLTKVPAALDSQPGPGDATPRREQEQHRPGSGNIRPHRKRPLPHSGEK